MLEGFPGSLWGSFVLPRWSDIVRFNALPTSHIRNRQIAVSIPVFFRPEQYPAASLDWNAQFSQSFAIGLEQGVPGFDLARKIIASSFDSP